MDVTITTSITPTFTAIGPLCQNSTAPVLPLTSANGITGTWSPAAINTAAVATNSYVFTPNAGQCAVGITMDVTITTSITPTFTAIGPLCQNSTAPVLSLTSANGITGTWSPAAINTVAVATNSYVFTPDGGQCAAAVTMDITVTTSITPTFTAIGPLCQNSTAPVLPLTSANGITGTWSPAAINTSAIGASTYMFTPDAGQCSKTTTMSISVNSQILTAFASPGALCQNSAAPALPTRSVNGITGTWNPGRISTTAIGTRTYTFTPGTGQCATLTTMDVTITASTTPTFAAIGPLCQNSIAPILPITSNNGITGAWSPAAINTAVVATSVYTFSPGANQCASSAALSVTINAQANPLFAKIGPLCLNGTAPLLLLASTNGITGTWSPATISTAAVGTATYTFTPGAGQCAAAATMNVTVTAQITPTFTQIGPLCKNSASPLLPFTSTNGIAGTWLPAAISTSAVGTSAYTFTPSAGQCTTSMTMNITIEPNVTPTFTQIGPLCQSSDAPSLPSVSTNGITGTWSPATIYTEAAATSTYTFTPNPGQCATVTTMSITINLLLTPNFTQLGPLCQSSDAPSLSSVSTNGISGRWSPATISTAAVGTATYTFTPNAGQCAAAATMNITVTSQIAATFTQIAPLCKNSASLLLPLTSTNGIAGTWSPAAINTVLVTSAVCTFTPNAGQCATGTTMNVIINPLLTPTFIPIGSVCQNGNAPLLPSTSTNGITGTWSPATINTAAVGTAVCTFTPDAGQCASGATMNITINPLITPTFAQIGPLCQGSAPPVLSTISTNGIIGTWSPAMINTALVATATYTFTPNAGQCASAATMNIITSSPITPTFAPLGPVCQNSTPLFLPSTSTNGITGSWSPALINTALVATVTYTFTPNAGQCATTAMMDITTVPQNPPIFTQIGPLCQSSTPLVLPLSSVNGITGTWSPAMINTAAVATNVYTFTPDAGQCAPGTSMVIAVNSRVIPLFDAIGPICQYSIAPVLSTTSNNGITGTWSPATINSALVATAAYVFTPDAGQCATTVSMSITVNPPVIPLFDPIGPLCQNSSAPVLPFFTINTPVLTGTWSPSVISTTSVATIAYTFTPNTGQCASKVSMDIKINPRITPTFAAINPICQNSQAPVLSSGSTNIPAISGTWSPATINTAVVATTAYTFTPVAGSCAVPTAMDISILPKSTSTTSVSVCSTQLPYTWNGQVINAAGTYQSVLVGSRGCDSAAVLNLVVNEAIKPVFAQIAPVLQGSVAPLLANISLNGITGTWNPAMINTAEVATTTYTFTPDAGQCAVLSTMDITIQMDAIIAGPTLTGVCEGATLNASKSVGDIVKYEWSLLGQGGTLDSTTGINTTFKVSGNYTGSLPADFRVKLKVTSRNGFTSCDTITITVDHPPVADVHSSGSLEKDGSMIVDGSVSTGTNLTYKWSTAQGRIMGTDNQPTVKLIGAGIYTLEISDSHGCTDSKSFQYPLAFHSITANPDYARIAWDQDTTINVLANDHSTVYLRPGSVTVTDPASRGGTSVNGDGSITYVPQGKNTGSDTFIYQVCDTLNFCASARVTIEIYDSGVKIPEAFSPNGDGENDFLVFPDLPQNHPNSQLYVYTRSGQLVYQSLNYLNNWDGRMASHQLVPTGTYYYVLKITVPYSRIIRSFIYIGY